MLNFDKVNFKKGKMMTKLDERSKLRKKIDSLSTNDLQKLSIFISGLEAAKKMYKKSEKVLEKQDISVK